MKQRHLKSLGVSVPQIALGTVELGLPYGLGLDCELTQPSFQEAERLLHAALDHGICFIDTARAYGESEDILGRCLSGRRAELVINTKFGLPQMESLSDAEITSAIFASVEQSLRALRTDYVDCVMLHSATLENVQDVARLMAPVQALLQQGKVRAFGASIYDEALQTSLTTPELALLQLAASVLDRRAEDALDSGAGSDKDVVIRSVLLRGALTEKYRELPDAMKPLRDAIEALDRLADTAGISLTELAYRYAADFDGLILVGTASVTELEQAIRYVECGSLSSDVLAAIRSTFLLGDHLLNPAQWPKFESKADAAR